jgi:tetratricopeptide (TPR) repeat protein
MLSYAAMMTGQSALAMRAMDELIATMPVEWAKEFSAIADGFQVMPLEVRMRFGRWDEVLAAPEFPEHFPIARALRHYVRGVAFAAKGQPDEARAEQAAFVVAKAKVPADAFFGNNGAAALLAVAEPLLAGEILYRDGKVNGGLAALRKAVVQEDALRYDEPPDWIQPVRHALGATLLNQGQYAEAERVYRRDLQKLPGNGWALFGLGRSLRLQGRSAEAAEVEAQFAAAWAKADVQLQSSCFCQPGR